jgi:alkylation response protein AidB-like acyl-CoA dehydrogenase
VTGGAGSGMTMDDKYGVRVELRDAVRAYLARHRPFGHLREHLDDHGDHPHGWWQRFAQELGAPGLRLPIERGGEGAGMLEVVTVFEELGGVLAGTPAFSTVALGAAALGAVDRSDVIDGWTARLLDGSATLAWADLEWLVHGAPPALKGRTMPNGDLELSGTIRVLDGTSADLIVGPVDLGDAVVLAGFEPGTGVSLSPTRCVDLTVRPATMALNGAAAWLLEQGPLDVLRRTVATSARLAIAADMVGAAESCLQMSVDYAKTRTQFGRPIGSYQAIKHKCADVLIAIERARTLVFTAAAAVDAGDPAGDTDALAALIVAGESFQKAADENIQIHGGIGFTWEHDAHLFFRHARFSARLLGDSYRNRSELSRRLHVLG